MTHHRMQMYSCPKCDYPLDAATNADGRSEPPKENDLSICINCGSPLVFDQDLNFQLMTPEIFITLHPEEIDALLRAGAVVIDLQQKTKKHD